jgi:hypothetical protein
MGFMPFNPSSIVKTAPHFGHFTCWSELTYPAQPKENAARTNNAATILIHFFTPLHLLSFGEWLPQLHNTIEETSLLHEASTEDLKKSPLSIIKANKTRFFSQGKNLGEKFRRFMFLFCKKIPRVKFMAKGLPILAFHVIKR